MAPPADDPPERPETWSPASPWDAGSAVPPASSDGFDPPAEPAGRDVAPRAFRQPEEARYEPQGELGRGGMGRVVRAHDRRLGRDVAVKVLREGRDARRMAREARITARLEHPGIVPVYNAGVDPDGRPFYTMRLVRGRSFADVLGECVDQEARLGLLRRVLDAAQAVAFAHSRGVVHRDLKPANLMLGAYGETQVVDWGLARVDDEVEDVAPAGSVTMAPGVSLDGAVIGTPAYMSPEQARGERGDARSDVWSLGVLLHELVTGGPPFQGPSSESILRQLQTEAPPRLEEPRELAAIVNRALAPDPADRYPDAGALAADLSSYIDGRRVEAHDYTAVELALRFVRAWRWPLGFAAALLAVVALLGAAAVSRITQERDRAVDAERETRAANDAAEAGLAEALAAQAEVARDRGARAEAEVLAAHALRMDERPEARGVLAAYGTAPRPTRTDAGPLPDCTRRQVGPDGSWLLCASDERMSFWRGTPPSHSWTHVVSDGTFSVSPGGDVVAQVVDGRIWLLDGETGTQRPERILGVKEHPTVVEDGAGTLWLTPRMLPAVRVRTRGAEQAELTEVQVCPRDTGRVLGAPLPGGGVLLACETGRIGRFVGDAAPRWVTADVEDRYGALNDIVVLPGDRAAVGTLEGWLLFVDLDTGRVVGAHDLDRGIIGRLQRSPDGRRLGLRGEGTGVLVWDVAAQGLVATLPAGPTAEFRFAADDTLLVFGSSLVRWTLPAAARPWRFAHGSGLTDAKVSPDGRAIALSEGSGMLRVFDLETGQ